MGQLVLLPLAVRAATNNSGDLIKGTEKEIHVIINVTAVPTIDTVTPKIQGKDALGNYYDLLVGTAIVAVSQVVLKVGVGIAAAANLSANDMLPDVYRVVLTHSAGTNFIYSVTENTAS